MTKFLVLWELDSSMLPKAPEERVKLQISMLEMVKADLQAGVLKDFGVNAGGGSGYSISESSETELFTYLLKWTPMLKFKVLPMITVDETIEGIKKVAEMMKK